MWPLPDGPDGFPGLSTMQAEALKPGSTPSRIWEHFGLLGDTLGEKKNKTKKTFFFILLFVANSITF